MCKIMNDDPKKKAINVRLDHNDSYHWIPRSLCDFKPSPGHTDHGLLEVESWFAEKEGMHE